LLTQLFRRKSVDLLVEEATRGSGLKRVLGPFELTLLAIALCFWLMINLPLRTGVLFGAWLLLGLVIYFTYSRRHSRLNPGRGTEDVGAAHR